jgi:hypothetical protein
MTPYVLILILASGIQHMSAISQFEYADKAACEFAGKQAVKAESYIEWTCIPARSEK